MPPAVRSGGGYILLNGAVGVGTLGGSCCGVCPIYICKFSFINLNLCLLSYICGLRIYICEFTFVNFLRSVSNTAVNLRSRNFKPLGFQPCDRRFTFVNWGVGVIVPPCPARPCAAAARFASFPRLLRFLRPASLILTGSAGLGALCCARSFGCARSPFWAARCVSSPAPCCLAAASRRASIRRFPSLPPCPALPCAAAPRLVSPPLSCAPPAVRAPCSALPALRASLAGRAACRASGCAGFLPSRAPFF